MALLRSLSALWCHCFFEGEASSKVLSYWSLYFYRGRPPYLFPYWKKIDDVTLVQCDNFQVQPFNSPRIGGFPKFWIELQESDDSHPGPPSRLPIFPFLASRIPPQDVWAWWRGDTFPRGVVFFTMRDTRHWFSFGLKVDFLKCHTSKWCIISFRCHNWVHFAHRP